MGISRPMLTLFLMGILVFMIVLNVAEKTAAGSNPYSYPIIQEAINNATEGDTIIIPAGTYYEHIVVNKTLTLIGENSSTTIIDGSKAGTVVTIEASNVRIIGFTIQNSGNANESKKYPIDCGIKINATLSQFQNVTVEDNVIMNNSVGIYAKYCNDNSIISNVFASNIGPPFVRYWDVIEWRVKERGTVDDALFVACNESGFANNQGTLRLDNCSSNSLLNCSQVFLSLSEENVIAGCVNSSLSGSNRNVVTNCSGLVSLNSSHCNTITYCSDRIDLTESNGNLIKNNKLATGESLAETNYWFNRTVRAGSGRNIIVENVLTNGSICVGGEPRVYSDGNVVANNTLDGGSIVVWGSHNVVSQNRIFGTEEAVHISGVQADEGNNTVSLNEITNSTVGLGVYSGKNEVSENVIRFNNLGMYVMGLNNTFTGNTISGNTHGIFMRSANNTLRDNRLDENDLGFICTLYASSFGPYNDIDTSNTINGKPIYYLFNQTDLNINPSTFPNVGYLGLVECRNITVRNLILTGNGEGLMLSQCVNCSVEGNTLEHNMVAVQAYANDTSISGNIVFNNWHGMTLGGDCNHVAGNLVVNNSIRLAPYRFPEYWPSNSPILEWFWNDLVFLYSGGINLWRIRNSTIIDNTLLTNEQGIYLYRSSFNTFKNNSMENNVRDFGIDTSRVAPAEWTYVGLPDPQQISPYLMNDVDASNTVNGKPIYWWINKQDEQVPADAGCVVLVNSTRITLKNLFLQNNTCGILLVDVNDTIISDSTIASSRYGIQMKPTTNKSALFNNTVINCSIARNGVAVYLVAKNCTISHSLIDRNLNGIYIDEDSNLNWIVQNVIANDAQPPREEWILGYDVPNSVFQSSLSGSWGGAAIMLGGANDTICYNTIQNNRCGIDGSSRGRDNKIHHNNFINNTIHVELRNPLMEYYPNTWDSGYPSGGNYWSDFNEADLFNGLSQNVTGSDGIGDTPVGIYPDNTDRYPLTAPITVFDAGTWNNVTYAVDIVSNSTVSALQFDPKKGALLRFDVAGENGTSGFCRVTIPRDLLTVEDGCTVLVGFKPVDCAILQDDNCAYLYFTYNHSTETVYIIGTRVVPEFPSFGFLLPLMILLAFPLVSARRKHLGQNRTES